MRSIEDQSGSYLFVGGKDSETGAGGLVLLRGPQGPEGNGTTAELGEPALELRLCGVVGQTRHVQDLASLGQEGAHVGASIHGTGQDVRVLVRGLGLADQATEDARQGNSLFHGTSGRGRGQSLQVEGEVVLDGGAGLDSLDLEGGTDVL